MVAINVITVLLNCETLKKKKKHCYNSQNMGTIVTSVYTVQNTTSLQKDTVNQSVKKKKILPSLPPK